MLSAAEAVDGDRGGELGMPARRSRGSARYVADLQRGRLLSATFALIGERGYEGVTARSVSERAGVSNRTFYQCFSDREDCLLAAFNHAIDGLEVEVRVGWGSELGWTARVRAALTKLLVMLDREPAVRRLVFVEALAAGPRVLARRARVLEGLAVVVDEGRVNAKAPSRLPALVAEGVVGGAVGVVHARLLELRPEPLVGLLSELMAMIVLPYRGSGAVARELSRPVPRPVAKRRDGDGLSRRPIGEASPVDYRLTARTQMALAAVAGRPGMNNREVSEIIGLADQGQVSRMMKRLQGHGLIENTQDARRLARAWRLTADGEAVIAAHQPLKRAQRTASKGGKLVADSTRRGKRRKVADGGVDTVQVAFRLTALTYEVLATVVGFNEQRSNPSNREVAHAAGVKDEGQISRLLARLESHGMLENAGGPGTGGNAWQITLRGEQLISASRSRQRSSAAQGAI